MNKPIIRPATERDIDAIIPLWREMMELHQQVEPVVWTMSDGADDAFRRYLAECLADNGHLVVIAESKGRVIGYRVPACRAGMPIPAAASAGLGKPALHPLPAEPGAWALLPATSTRARKSWVCSILVGMVLSRTWMWPSRPRLAMGAMNRALQSYCPPHFPRTHPGIVELLTRTGLEWQHTYGALDMSDFGPDCRRMLVVARKAARRTRSTRPQRGGSNAR